ncbi:UDP-N-acetyl-D-glucosamine dehydrogenase, partial [Candidatus Bathyarchaeota archaeon]|nr:UDP-N-acetyl-D-glucosamine dehydrogenase [Candidatus Bathyarchaeota archaeon]
GGHCIPLDPYYLSYKSKRMGYIPRFIELSGGINEYMKTHTVNLVEESLERAGLPLGSSTVSLLGLAYKKGINDTRESPTIKVIEELVNAGVSIKVYDPYVAEIKTSRGVYSSERTLEEALLDSDCAVFMVDHTELRAVRLETLLTYMRTPVVVDCKNLVAPCDGLIYLGIGKKG